MKTTLIFDLDGTLLDTLEDLKDSTNYALHAFGFPTRTLDEVRAFVGNGLRMLIRRAVPAQTDEATVDTVLAEMKRYYSKNYHNKTKPYVGIPEILRRFQEEGYPMAIVSNKAGSVVTLLRELYFDKLIPVAVGEMPGVARKPAPDMVYEGMKRLGVGRENAVYIGDSEVDLQTARNAGLPCLSVTWGFRTEAQLIEAGAQKLCHTPEELYEAVRALGEITIDTTPSI